MSSFTPTTRRSFLTGFGGGLLSSVGLVSAHSSYTEWKNTPFSKDMKIIGHRGANGLAPQNTLYGIELAAKYNVDGVELDVQEASDGTLVMFHDPIYDVATDNGSGIVENVPYSKAKKFHTNGHYVITLDDALRAVTEHNIELFLEIKSSGIIDKCLQKVSEYNWQDKTTFISLDVPYLDGAHSEINTAVINSFPRESMIYTAKQLQCTGVATHYFPIQQEDFIREANKVNLNSIIWSLVDTETSIRDSLKSDADILIANRPDIINKIYIEDGVRKKNQA